MTEKFEGFGKKRDGFSHFAKRHHLGFVKSLPCDKSKNVVLDFSIFDSKSLIQATQSKPKSTTSRM